MPEDVKIQPVPRKPVDVTEISDPTSVRTGGAKPEKKLDPTRYGDWERGGRCIDF